MAKRLFLDLPGLQNYDAKAVVRMQEAIAAGVKNAKDHADSLADNYDAAGTAQSKVEELANGQVKTNKEAIEAINHAETGILAQAKAEDAKLQANIDKVDEKADKNAEDIAAINNAETGILKQAKAHAESYADGKDAAIQAAKKAGDDAQSTANANAGEITTLKGRMDAAEQDIDNVETDLGNVDSLSTTNKTVVGAINEVLAAVGTGGTAAVVTMSTDVTTEGALKSYTFKQGDATIGTIDIPKDLVVESGSVVTLAENEVEGQPAGTYIKLVLAVSGDELYINVGTLVDIYKAQASATQIQLAIDSVTREISATIVAGSVGTTELADNAVTTAKIADANVTKAKLSSEVQASLAKADAATPNATFEEKVAALEGADSGLDSRLQAVEGKLGTGEGSVDAKIESAKQEAIQTAAGDATQKANKAKEDAIAHANGLASNYATAEQGAKADTAVQKVETGATNGTIKVDGAEVAVKGLGSAAYTNVDAYEVAGEAAKVQGKLDTEISERKAADSALDTKISGHADRLTALEEKVGEGCGSILEADINALFN